MYFLKLNFYFQRSVYLQWSKDGGELPRGRAADDRQGNLVITDIKASDSGVYICTASDGYSFVTERATLNVEEEGKYLNYFYFAAHEIYEEYVI